MRAVLLFTATCFGLSACADPAEQDAGLADAAPAADLGPRADTGTPPDAGTMDATAPDLGDTDAAPMDADVLDALPADTGPRTGPVTVVFRPGDPSPRSEGTAIFQGADGEIIATRTTTTGAITQIVPEGSMVTVSLEIDDGNQDSILLFTITGLAPNEVYGIDRYRNPMLIANVTFNGGAPHPSAANYTYQYGCGTLTLNGDPSVDNTFGIGDDCTGTSTSTFTFLASAYDAGGTRLGFRVAENIPLVDGSRVELTGPWRTDFVSIDITTSNPLPGAFTFYGYLVVAANHASIDEEGSYNFDLPSGLGTHNYPKANFGDALLFYFDQIGGSTNGRSSYWKSSSAFQSITLDLTADFLAFPSDVGMTRSSTTPDRPTATWSENAGADFMVLQVVVDNFTTDWKIFLPGDATSFTFPALPAGLARFRPSESTNLDSAQQVYDSTTISNYTEARATFGRGLTGVTEDLLPGYLPPDSTVRIAGHELEED